jgi:hypothetical protein
MDQAEQHVSIVGVDFRKFDARTLPGHNIPDDRPGLNNTQMPGRTKAHQDFFPEFESVEAGEKKASAAQGGGDAPETILAHSVIHRNSDVEPRISPCVRAGQFFHSSVCERFYQRWLF